MQLREPNHKSRENQNTYKLAFTHFIYCNLVTEIKSAAQESLSIVAKIFQVHECRFEITVYRRLNKIFISVGSYRCPF